MNEFENRPEPHDSDKTPFLDLTLLVVQNLPLLILVPVVAALTAVVFSFFVTPRYSATARAYVTGPHDQYIGILRSRRLLDSIVERFALKERYGAPLADDARKELQRHTKVSRSLAVVSVEVQDKDPDQAAKMANAFIEELRNLTQTLAITESSERRLFFEMQLHQIKGKLAEAEAALQASGAREQLVKKLSGSSLDSMARLNAQIAFHEIRLTFRELKLSQSDVSGLFEFKSAVQDFDGLRAAVARAEHANASNALAEAGRYGSVYRDFVLHQTLYQLLADQVEIARLEEARSIQSLERAVPPERASYPRQISMAVEVAIVAFALTLLSILLWRQIMKMRAKPSSARKLAELTSALRFRRKPSPGGP